MHLPVAICGSRLQARNPVLLLWLVVCQSVRCKGAPVADALCARHCNGIQLGFLAGVLGSSQGYSSGLYHLGRFDGDAGVSQCRRWEPGEHASFGSRFGWGQRDVESLITLWAHCASPAKRVTEIRAQFKPWEAAGHVLMAERDAKRIKSIAHTAQVRKPTGWHCLQSFADMTIQHMR